MSKRAVSVTLRADNLLWLKTRARADGLRSLSEALDQIISRTRAADQKVHSAIRSVMGNARIPASEATLEEAGRQLRQLFRNSIQKGGEELAGSGSRRQGRSPGRKGA